LNDAPSLAPADVGVNFRKNAASATISGAVTIVNSKLSSLPALYRMARMTMDQVRFNLCWIFAYNVVALALATEVIAPFGMRLSP
jgi:P-type E1-E2 ATPase